MAIKVSIASLVHRT